jgi:hypothetical protein
LFSWFHGSRDGATEPVDGRNAALGGGGLWGGAWEVTLAKAFLLPDSQVLHTCGEC